MKRSSCHFHHGHYVALYLSFLLLLLSRTAVLVQGRTTLLNAYKTQLERLTAPNAFYFLEFPRSFDDDETISSPKCGNGSPYSFVFRRGSDEHLSKLLVEFEGGPASWNTANELEQSACNDNIGRRQTAWYNYLQLDEDTEVRSGLFPPLSSCTGVAPGFAQIGSNALFGPNATDVPIALRDTSNNVQQWWELLNEDIRDWSYILLPHCTLDWHLGHQAAPQPTNCGDGDTIYQRGGTNAQAVLDWVNTQFEASGGLAALVTTSGGRIGGCDSQPPADTSSIAPIFFAAGANMQSDSKKNKLVLIEGASLWKDNLPDQDTLITSWNASDLVPSFRETSSLLDTVEYMVTNTDAQYAWFAGATITSKIDEELRWLAKLKKARPNAFHLYVPSTTATARIEATSCPLFAFSDSNPPNEDLSTFLTEIASSVSWSLAPPPSGGGLRSSISDAQDDDNNGSRLTFVSIVVILLSLLAFAWLLYYLIKHYRGRQKLPPPPSPNDLWFLALTHYPGLFLLISLAIPISLSFAGYAKAGYQINMNLDFESYLDINTEMENVAQSYAAAQSYQLESLDIEDQNCAVLNENHAFHNARKILEQEMDSMTMQGDLPFSIEIEEGTATPPFADEPQFPLTLTERELQYELYTSSGQKISILYQNRDGGSVFEPKILESIRRFEQSILDFPGFSDYCFSLAGRCVPFDSIVPLFFPRGELVSNVDGVLQSFLGDPTAIWKVDQYFGPDNLASNITRTFVWLRNVGGDQSAANEFLERLYRDLLWETDQERPFVYPDMVFTWANGHMGDLEASDAVNHDALWAAGSFIFIGLMILFKVRNVFVFVCSMLGLGLSFASAYYFCSVHFDIPDITLLHVSSLFVMMGIGADDIFLMVDSFEHTEMATKPEQQNEKDGEHGCADDNDDDGASNKYKQGLYYENRGEEIIRKRMKSAYATAGSMMLVSSLTTSICFFSNAFAVVVVIQEFGIYMGMVVLLNFVHVMTILPSAILVNEFYILPWWKKFRCCCHYSTSAPEVPRLVEAGLGEKKNSKVSLEAGMVSNDQDPDVSETASSTNVEESSNSSRHSILHGKSAMNRMDRWLVTKYSPFVSRRRFQVVFIIVTMSLFLGTLGIITFKVSDGTIILFSENYNLGRWNALNEKYFNGDLSKTIETISSGGFSNGGVGNGGGGSDSNPNTGGGTENDGNVGGSNGSGSVDGGDDSDGNSNITGGAGNSGSVGDGNGSGSGNAGSNNSPSTQTDVPAQQPTDGPAADTQPTNSVGGVPTVAQPTSGSPCAQACYNGGTCTFAGVCYCENGWSGDVCTVPVCPTNSGALCSGRGACVNHSSGVVGSTDCLCDEEYSGIDCGRLKVEAEPLTRREAIVVRLIWGVEPAETGSNLWVIKAPPPGTTRDKKGAALIGSSFDLSEPHVQGWLLEVVQLARNDTELNVQIDSPTWIEVLHEFAIEAGVGFPIPKTLFVGYLELLKKRSPLFSALIMRDIGTLSPGLAGDFIFASITLRADVVRTASSLSEITFTQWRDFVDSVNKVSPPNVPQCVGQSNTFLNAHRSEETINSTASSWLIANGLCLAIILLFTQNVMLSFMVMVVIILIFLCLAGLLFGIFLLPFGPIEALGVSIFIGLSANYSLHIVHAYHHSSSSVRASKVKEAIFVTGSSITASALSTIGGCLFLFACRTWVFVELGILICCITAMALLFSMLFLPAWLTMLGPLPIDNDNGDSTGEHQQQGHRLHQCDLKALLCTSSCGFYKDTRESGPIALSRASEDALSDEEDGDSEASDQNPPSRSCSERGASKNEGDSSQGSGQDLPREREGSQRALMDSLSLLDIQKASPGSPSAGSGGDDGKHGAIQETTKKNERLLSRSSSHFSARVLMDGSIESLDVESLDVSSDEDEDEDDEEL